MDGGEVRRVLPLPGGRRGHHGLPAEAAAQLELNRPPAEAAIDEDLVRALLQDQAPDLAALPLYPVGDHGWDNTVYRLGNDHAVRLPRRAAAAALVAHELRWLPLLAPGLPLPVPEPVVAGRPAKGYPWPWAVVRWLPGEPIGTSDVATIDPLLDFLDALHRPAPPEAPANPHLGGPLADRDARLRDGCTGLARRGWDAARILRAWNRALTAEPYDGPPLWLHGDLHTANVLAHRASIRGVIDFGDLTAGDPACDYLIAWMLAPPHRQLLREAAEHHGPGTWERARGWALAWAVAVLGASDDTPLLQAIGSKALAAACESAG